MDRIVGNMERKASTILRYLVNLRSSLLAFAIFDFVVIWIMSADIRLDTVRPWNQQWTYLIGPIILLVSSIFLSTNRWWGNTVALLSSGCFFVYFLRLLLIDDLAANPRYDEIFFWIDHPYLFGFQYLFALIVICYSAASLKRNFLSRQITAAEQ